MIDKVKKSFFFNGAGAVPYNPDQESGILAYWRNAGLATDGTGMIDSVGGYNVTGGAEHPVYTLNAIGTKAAMVFDANDFLSRLKIPAIEGVAKLSWVIVGKNATQSQDDGSTNVGRISIQQADGVIYALPCGYVAGVIALGSVDKSPAANSCIIAVYDGTLTGDANRLKIWYNGVQQTVSFTAGSIPALTNSNVLSTFNFHKAAGAGSAGVIGEVAMYLDALSSAAVARINAYETTLFGL